ncbi:kinase-like protein [Eremomyces bilateralis CBS 781.70]|uniref:Kinase-like protein n=1 Tax=Eremomyces bilateralis CBS 781.70 TaxID=1392243 RepID=A0A6G1G5X9_9PEZI|nr:kinase-like protein [Eremomyces bilateralis CBS 781.70]KAF1813505.1 kinase-like protein [Eremomyces bilateralis CBS 781.70]
MSFKGSNPGFSVNCLLPSQRTEFATAQTLVITPSIDPERGGKGQRQYFQPGERLPFKAIRILGSGSFSQVDFVRSLNTPRNYARKRVLRATFFREEQTEHMKQFIAEIEILKRLYHRHVVKFVGSYTDSKYLGLIIYPVAEMNLITYLSCADTARYGELRTFFGCLPTALEFLHEQKIRHKDIKPANILVYGGKVLFTDFGISRDFTDAAGSTTFGTVNWSTARYCAPEVADRESRNTSSDIWSLGVVFLEMVAVLKGRAVEVNSGHAHTTAKEASNRGRAGGIYYCGRTWSADRATPNTKSLERGSAMDTTGKGLLANELVLSINTTFETVWQTHEAWTGYFIEDRGYVMFGKVNTNIAAYAIEKERVALWLGPNTPTVVSGQPIVKEAGARPR